MMFTIIMRQTIGLHLSYKMGGGLPCVLKVFCSEGLLFRRLVGVKFHWSEHYAYPSFMFVAD